MADEDPYLWLEDVTGERALDWVRARSEESTGRYATGSEFDALRDALRAVLDADGRIPYVTRRGEHLYNFWQDADHPRGLWRRTTLEEYRTDAPGWDVVLDIDALARDEDENWVWQGADVLRPGHRLALVQLSRGGADAAVVREFDIEERRFVKDGFELPEAKSRVGWIDADRVYLGTDFGEGSLTDSGYPRLVKEWSRGTSPDQVAATGRAQIDVGAVEVDRAVHEVAFITGRRIVVGAHRHVLGTALEDRHRLVRWGSSAPLLHQSGVAGLGQ